MPEIAVSCWLLAHPSHRDIILPQCVIQRRLLIGAILPLSNDEGAGNLEFAGRKAAFSYFDPETGEIKLATKKKKGFNVTSVATVGGSEDPGAKVVIDPATKKHVVVFYDAASDGIYVANKDGEVTLVSEGGSANTPVVIDCSNPF